MYFYLSYSVPFIFPNNAKICERENPQNSGQEGTSCHGFRKVSEPIGEVDLPHLPWASDRTLQPWLWPKLLSSLQHCKQQGVHDWPRWGEKVPCIQNQVWTWEPVASLAPGQWSGSRRSRREIWRSKREICLCHEEKFLLFCEEDDKAICWLCKWSQEHCGHHTFLMEKVAQKNQVRDQNGGKTRQKWYLKGNVYFALDLITCSPWTWGSWSLFFICSLSDVWGTFQCIPPIIF